MYKWTCQIHTYVYIYDREDKKKSMKINTNDIMFLKYTWKISTENIWRYLENCRMQCKKSAENIP